MACRCWDTGKFTKQTCRGHSAAIHTPVVSSAAGSDNNQKVEIKFLSENTTSFFFGFFAQI